MFLLFDIGGTKMRFAASPDGESFGEPVKVSTPYDNFEEGLRLFIENAHKLSGGGKIEKAFGGIAGVLDPYKTKLVNSPHIGGWVNKPLKDELERGLGCEVVLENDAAMVGLGEAIYGAGKGHQIVAYVTVSTGVGGARIVKGRIDTNRYGFEVGHQIVDLYADDLGCAACPEEGHLEGFISGAAFERRFGKPAHEVADPEAWQDAAKALAIGLNNVAVFWSPDIIVLGGSMIAGEKGSVIPFNKVEEYYQTALKIFPQKPKLARAALRDEGGLWGAMAMFNNLKINL